MSPRDAALVAVGFRSGVLCLVDAVQGVVLHRVDAHDQELQSVSWCLRGDHGAWLASSSRDKSIKIWRVGDSSSEGGDDARSTTKDARELVMDRVLRLPTGKQGQAYNPSKHLWLPVAWSTATGGLGATETKLGATMRLWSGSFDGNLLLWEIPVRKALEANATRSGGSPPVKPVAVKNGHNRILFNIVALPSGVDAFHRQQQLPTLLTVSLDRELRLWTETRAAESSGGAGTPPAPTAARTVGKLLGLGGHVYCVAHNEQASTVALACGDQTIRLWKLRGGKEGGLYNTELLWKGLKSKVTSVAWHPLAPSVLAFGTEDGTLGVYDTQSKKQARFRSSHVGEVQQLEWRLDSGASSTEDGEAEAANGPSAFLDAMHELERAQAEGTSLDDALVELEASKRGQQGDRSPLRVVLWSRDASGQLLESDAEHPDAQSLVVSAARGCSSFACSDTEDVSGLVAIGNPNGSVKLVRAHLMKSPAHGNDKVVHDHNERISSIAWSTRGGARLLATGSDDGKIFVYRFDSDTPMLVAQLAGHSGKITRLRWQPPPPSAGTNGSSGGDALPLLASCAADGSARVWDVLDRERQPVARFYDHIGRVLALDWVASSVLVTGGEDQTARMWDLRSFPAHVDAEHGTGSKDPSVVPISRPRASSAKQNDSKPAAKEVEAAKKDSASTPTGGGKKQKKKTRATSPALFHSATPTPLHEVAHLLARRLDQPQQALLARSDQLGASQDGSDAFMPALLQLAHHESSLDPRRSMMSFASAEQTRFASEGDWEGKARLLLLGGQISDALRVVANEGMLDATWLAFAPMAGMDVWREMSNLFAVQLEARGDHAQAALHFLSVGKVRAAVRALVGGSAFREALALIRLRLGPSDPLVSETTWKFAEWLEARGSFGDAALAFVSLERCEPAHGVTTAVDASEATSWRWRAVRALVKTRSAACVAQAVELLHEGASTGTSEALAFPATFLTVDIIGVLVRERQFAVAERASELLLLSSPSLRIHSSLPMATTSFRLTRCLLGILSAMDRHGSSSVESSAALVKGERLVSLQRQWPSNEAVQLLLALVCDDGAESSAYPASLVADLPDALVGRADGFWSDVLDVCRLCGVWSAGRDTQDEEEGDPGGNLTLEEAQELLMDDESSWMLVEWRTAMAGDSLSSSALRVDAAIDVLRLVVDALARCLVSAMEHLARLLADVVDSSLRDDGRVDNDIASLAVELVTLVFPVGVASCVPVSLLAIGELAEEQEDAHGLWRTARLLQCRALVSRCAHVAAAVDARTWAADTARCVLDEVVEDCGVEQDDDDEGSHRDALREELEALERDQLGVETS